MIKTEPLKKHHFEQYEGSPPPYTMRGVAALDGDEVVGICTVIPVLGEKIVAFDIKDASCMQIKRMIIKGWQDLKPLLTGRCIAFRDEEKPTSMDFLTHFGFEPEGDVYVYRGDSWVG